MDLQFSIQNEIQIKLMYLYRPKSSGTTGTFRVNLYLKKNFFNRGKNFLLFFIFYYILFYSLDVLLQCNVINVTFRMFV